MIKKTPKGMRDFLPKEKRIRNKVLDIIKDEYYKNGFNEIETSMIEHLENMDISDAGENSKLIFKILKRGEKLDLSKENINENDLADLALRFDLTLPLCRFYSNNQNEFQGVFKTFQIGNVFRAERPQKGRYRTFMQCDIDIIGEESNLAEIELINTMYKTLKRFKLGDFVFNINDRRVLKAICKESGFDEKDYNDILISLDKIDKIDEIGVINELLKKGYKKESINRLIELNEQIKKEKIEIVKKLDINAYKNLNFIINSLEEINENINIVFDHTLVRGMGYYTSTIFEIRHKELNYAIGGGGRYDEMIGKISETSAPACGFSIGYERLVDLLANNNYNFEDEDYIAILYSEDDNLSDVIKLADELRKNSRVSIYKKKKKTAKQIEKLKDGGFNKFLIYAKDYEIKDLNV